MTPRNTTRKYSKVVGAEIEYGPMTSRYALSLECGHVQRVLRTSIHNHKTKPQPKRVVCRQCETHTPAHEGAE